MWDLTVEKIPHNKEAAAAEVVGSTPTQSISFILVNYGIELRLFSVIVGQEWQEPGFNTKNSHCFSCTNSVYQMRRMPLHSTALHEDRAYSAL